MENENKYPYNLPTPIKFPKNKTKAFQNRRNRDQKCYSSLLQNRPVKRCSTIFAMRWNSSSSRMFKMQIAKKMGSRLFKTVSKSISRVYYRSKNVPKGTFNRQNWIPRKRRSPLWQWADFAPNLRIITTWLASGAHIVLNILKGLSLVAPEILKNRSGAYMSSNRSQCQSWHLLWR